MRSLLPVQVVQVTSIRVFRNWFDRAPKSSLLADCREKSPGHLATWSAFSNQLILHTFQQPGLARFEFDLDQAWTSDLSSHPPK